MAKAKSKKITLEEALVPVEEQPYEVPENWCWVYGLSIFKDMETKKPTGESFNYIDIDSIDNINQRVIEPKIIETSKAPGRASRKLHTGDTVFSMVRPYLKNIAYISEDFSECIASTGFYICTPKDCIDSRYLYYLMISSYVVDGVNAFMKGDNSPSVRKNDIEGFAYPLPPLEEQKRIVEQIENLFAKLDKAKEKAVSVIESFELRKKSILYNAFSGMYSTDWRAKHHCSLEDWEGRKIKEICIPRAGFAFDSKKFTNDGIQIIRMGNLYAGKLELSRSPVFYDKSDVDDNIIKRSMVHDGDILLTLTGTKYKRDYGYAVCIKGEHELLVNQRILCLSPTEKIDKEYLLYYLRSEIFRDVFFSNETGGVNQGNVSSKFVENIEIKLPSIEEQQEISKVLKNVLAKEEQAKELAEIVIEQIELMKKSILTKAFRGELGTNVSSEENSIELLKKMIEEGYD